MKKFVILFVMFMACSLFIAQTSFSSSDEFIQETYLFQKSDNVGPDEPWKIVLPGDDDETPYGKFEYMNYPFSGSFGFDFKGYNIPVNKDGEFAYGSYALIYYVDPGPDTWEEDPDVYVLGVADEVWESPAKGKGKGNGKGSEDVPPGHEGANLKISKFCNIDQIPVSDDVNYPNGGKIWLVPTKYLDYTDDSNETTDCQLGTMTGWPSDVKEILFETSLITYGFVAEEEE